MLEDFMKNYPYCRVPDVANLRDVIKNRVKENPDNPVFLHKIVKGGEYVPVMPAQFDKDIDTLGTALMSMLRKNARVAILAETRYEWYCSYLASTNGTGCVVPIDKELSPEEIQNMLDRAEVDLILFSSSYTSKIDEIYGKNENLKFYVCMDDTTDDRFITYSSLMEKGKTLLANGDRTFLDAPIDTEAMTILLFTSGTTAKSKAVMLNQRNICFDLMAMFKMMYIDKNDTFMSVLPLHHTYECTCGFIGQVFIGSTVAICEGLRYITTNIKECKPTMILFVPAMLEMFYKAINKKINSDPKIKRKFSFGIKLSKFLLHLGIDVRKKLFKDIHDTFGGRMRFLIVGGAAINPSILQFFKDIGINAIQGYGLTECSPILAVNRDVISKNESAGLPVPGVEVKVANPDEEGIGEFIAKGPNIFMGYYHDPDATAASFDENGYYLTGDLGYIDKDGFVIITGRKKNVIITKNGKNVFPEEIEYLLSLNQIVQESVVSSKFDEKKDDDVIIATIFPNMEEIESRLGSSPSEDKIQELLEEAVEEVNEKLVNYKRVKSVVYRPTEFEKNTSRKIKRY